MNKDVIWSSNGTRDYISQMGDEEKFNTLVDWGYDPEMLANVENIDDVLSDDDYMWQNDVEEFEENVLPMINDQTLNGIVIVGDKAVFADQLAGGDIDPNVYDVVIEYDGEGLTWNGVPIYAIPEDETKGWEFIRSCLHDAIDDKMDVIDSEDEFVDEIYEQLTDVDFLNSYLDFDAVKKVCDRIQPYGFDLKAEESLNEEEINEATTKNREGLANEINEIKPLADDYGIEFFTSMPFSNYDNDEQSIEYQYPKFAKVCKAFFKEMGIIDAANINDMNELDDNWAVLDQHDWDTIIEVCDRLVDKGGSHQFEKIYKNGYNSPIDDEQVLADRENQEGEIEEDLVGEGANIEKLRKKLMALDDEQIDEDTITKLPKRKHVKEEVIDETGETFFEPWDHDGDEDLNATIYLYSQDYDGTPESLQEIENDLRDYFFYDDSDEEFIQSVLQGVKASKEIDEDANKPDEDAELAKQLLKDAQNKMFEEKSLDDELNERLENAAKKYRNYAGLVDEDLTEELDEYAANRACHEFNLSKDELKGALKK